MKKEIEIEFEYLYFVDVDGSVCDIREFGVRYVMLKKGSEKGKKLFIRTISEMLKSNYNLFPSRELAEKASDMSLYERKQYLFAIAKGYEVLTRDEAVEALAVETLYELYFETDNHEWSFDVVPRRLNGSMCFKEEQHAQECADWMNESEDKE